MLARGAKVAANPRAWFHSEASAAPFEAQHRLRMAIVAVDADDLAAKMQFATEHALDLNAGTQAALREKGVFIEETPDERPRVAFLFPGQGSQYPGMMQSLAQEYAPVAQTLESMDAVLTDLRHPTFETVAWKETDLLGDDVWRTQASLLMADYLAFTALRSLDITPDCVSGHSFGEFPALLAAGAWDFENAAKATHARCQAIENCRQAEGVMLSSAAEVSVVERMCSEIHGSVFVSNHNAPNQTVAAGDEQSVMVLSDRLKEAGIASRRIAVPRPFHTPLMEEVKQPLGGALRSITISPPTTPLLSSVDNRFVADPEAIRENLVLQMTQPVRWVDLIHRHFNNGVNVFVEVGPDQILTRLGRRILDGGDAIFIPTDHKKRGGLEMLLRVKAHLETLGYFDTDETPAYLRAGGLRVLAQHEESTSQPATPSSTSSGQTQHQDTPPVDGHSPGEPSDGAGAPQTLELSGGRYEMGLAHGRAMAPAIQKILRRYADLAGHDFGRLPDVNDAVAQYQQMLSGDDLQELTGIADGAGVSLNNVIAHNLRLYPDAASGCTSFAITAELNGGAGLMHGANEDLPLSLSVRDCLIRHLQIRKPTGGLAHVTFGVAGEMAGINGVNQAGIAVTSTMLLDRLREPTAPRGRAHTAIVAKILQSAQTLDQAIAIVHEEPADAAWSVCLSHRDSDQLVYIEYDGAEVSVHRQPAAVAAANHAQLLSARNETPAHSQHRLHRLVEVLGGSAPRATVADAQAALRDRFDGERGRVASHPTMNTVERVDNQMSVIFDQQTQEVWYTAGPLSETPDTYHRLSLAQAFGQSTLADASTAPTPAINKPPLAVIDIEDHHRATQALDGAPSDGNLCQRFILRVVDQPLAEGDSAQPELAGEVIILGLNDQSRAMEKHLTQQGATVHLLAASEDTEGVLRQLDQILGQGPAPHLILATPFDAGSVSLDPTVWSARRRLGTLLPFLVTQRWYAAVDKAGMLEKATLFATTRLGGDLGFSGQIEAIESGALSGLLKGVRVETGLLKQIEITCKVIDSGADVSAEALADNVWREWGAPRKEFEVGYAGGRRYVVRPTAQAIDGLHRSDIQRGGAWLVTGGARGVTASVAIELGQRYGLKMHLVGSSPLTPVTDQWRTLAATDDGLKELRGQIMKDAAARGEKPIVAWGRIEKALEIDSNLQAYAKAGVTAVYHACDLGDGDQVARLLEGIQSEQEPLQGVLHGAGYEKSCRFDKKTVDMVERTFSAKVDSAAHLLRSLANTDLNYFLAFGSTSGRFGSNGQNDYCAANDMLAKLIDWHSRQGDLRGVCFHWPAWDGVGMAVRPEIRGLLESRGLRFMPPEEGAEHLIQELRAGLPETESLIMDWGYYRRYYPEAASKESTASR